MVHVLLKAMSPSDDELYPINVCVSPDQAQSIAEKDAGRELTWRDYSGDLGGWVNDNAYVRYVIVKTDSVLGE